jgi:hypothetical protein
MANCASGHAAGPLLFWKVACLYPVEIQYKVHKNKANKDKSCVLMKNLKGLVRHFIAKQGRYRLIDNQQKQNRSQNFVNGVLFHISSP